jgi:hypothetical protein
VTGTSTFGGGIAALNDADSLTAWTNAQIGDTLIFKFPSNLPRELNGTPFYGVDIANGRLHPESGFKEFGRIKTIRLCHNNQPLCTIRLADTRRWQHVTFPDVYLNVGDTLAIEVLDTYPGKKEQTRGHHRNRASRRALKIPVYSKCRKEWQEPVATVTNLRVNYRIDQGESDTSFLNVTRNRCSTDLREVRIDAS